MAKFVDIVLPLPINQAFTYGVPYELAASIAIGCRVIVPFGRRRLTGFVVKLRTQSKRQDIRMIEDLLDLNPLINSEILDLAYWLSDYYFCAPGEALKVAIPSVFMRASRQMVSLGQERPENYMMIAGRSAPRQSQILRYVSENGTVSVERLRKKLGGRSLVSSLKDLEQKKLVELRQVFSGKSVGPKTEKYFAFAEGVDRDDMISLVERLQRKAPRQAACVRFLHEKKSPVSQKDLLKATGASSVALNTLVKKNIIAVSTRAVFRDYYDSLATQPLKPVQLNPEQSEVLSRIIPAIESRAFMPFLLFGVTGSGKTQVYIEAIAKTLEQGRTAIALVPEISLTPQTVQRFRAYFHEDVAVLHSAMSEGERYDSWHKIRQGLARVVIGPRSAIFAPLRSIGLIVVDEEHESSYKQTDSNPRYHARDVAVMRAKQSNAVIVLGSATPSAESFHNANHGKYELLELKKRVNDVPLPEVKIIDLMKERRLSGSRDDPIFSRLLIRKIEEKTELKQQVILLLNRRGFSSHIKCRDCGFVETCDHCAITLTYHLRGRRLRCHYCGFSKTAPASCPECNGADILFRGLGTQKVEEALKARLPRVRVIRMDLDTTSGKWSHDRILSDFGLGKYDVLLGTQMVAKGLDFSRVTLVGVISADTGMLIPDFRSSERTFQLLTQVAGRSGRDDLEGEVIIQTYSPESFCLQCAQKHDFRRFYAGEIEQRAELDYPPFGRLICVHFKGEQENHVKRAATIFAGILRKHSTTVQILGPTPSPIDRIQNNYRYQLLLKIPRTRSSGSKSIRQAVRQALLDYGERHSGLKVAVTADVDPVSIM